MDMENSLWVLQEVMRERLRQDEKWGEQNWPDMDGRVLSATVSESTAKSMCDSAFKDGTGTYSHILHEEFIEALSARDQDHLREELIQVAAVAVAWIEKIDRDKRKLIHN